VPSVSLALAYLAGPAMSSLPLYWRVKLWWLQWRVTVWLCLVAAVCVTVYFVGPGRHPASCHYEPARVGRPHLQTVCVSPTHPTRTGPGGHA
jgi:hypothetical protein